MTTTKAGGKIVRETRAVHEEERGAKQLGLCTKRREITRKMSSARSIKLNILIFQMTIFANMRW